MAIDSTKGAGSGPRQPVSGNSDPASTPLGQAGGPVIGTPGQSPLTAGKRSLLLLLPWLNLLGGKKNQGIPPAPQAEPQRPPVPLLAKEKAAQEKQLEKIFVQLEPGTRDDKPLAPPLTSTLTQHQDPTSKVKAEVLVPGALLGRMDEAQPADNHESFREYMRRRGLVGIAQWVWYDPERGRPGSLKTSIAVNAVLTVLLVVWLLKWFE